MTSLYIMCGLPFSGKTTLAKKIAEHGFVYIGFDALWMELERDPKTAPKKGDMGWTYVRSVAKQMIKEELEKGNSVVYDDINVKQENREELKELAQGCGADFQIVYVCVEENERIERMERNSIEKQRHDVEEENLRKAEEQFEEPRDDVIVTDGSVAEVLKAIKLARP